MKRGSSSSLLFVWRRCGDDCVSSRNLNGRFNGSMIHHPRSTFNEVSSCKAVEIQVLKGLHPSSRNHPSSSKTIRRLLPIQWPQPQNEEICLAMEEAEFEEKREEKRRESLRRKKLRVIKEEDGDGNSNTGSCTDHIPRDKHHPLASKDEDSQEEHDSILQHEETIVLRR
ncbi:hypothetical protein DY000_02017252 [Brassica cretica]|uniref:Uncharacterized protein n=1 Tax=Brassica cretica TaxID=69181 RepID=A0ABQ7DAK4_BRACR|nr:hypothetical protein DY000_02017252 [Brassica cretica]